MSTFNPERSFAMPIFNDYSQDGKLLSTRDEILNSGNLNRFITEFGDERKNGYIDATLDLVKSIELILGTPWLDGGVSPNTPAEIRNKLSAFLKERQEFLTFNSTCSKISDTKLSI